MHNAHSQLDANSQSLLALADHHRHTGHLAQAENIYQQLSSSYPYSPVIHYSLAQLYQDQKQWDKAIFHHQQLLDLQVNSAEAHASLGYIYDLTEKWEQAEYHYQQALHYDPNFVAIHNNLGCLLQRQRRFQEAISHFQTALHLQPNFAEAHNNLGNVFWEQGELERAQACYEQAIESKANFSEAHRNLGQALQAMGRIPEAVAHYQQAFEEQTASVRAAAYQISGQLLESCLQFDQAVIHYRQAMLLTPYSAHILASLARALTIQGKWQNAQALCQYALQLHPDNLLLYLKAITAIPIIPHSVAEILTTHQRIFRQLKQLLTEKLPCHQDPFQQQADTLFFTAYHGLNDRDLQSQLAAVYQWQCPNLHYTAPHCEAITFPLLPNIHSRRIKIGFISNFLREHTVGKVTAGLFSHFNRQQFHISVFFINGTDNRVSNFVRQHVDYWENLPLNLSLARQKIAEQELDILCYLDIGMENFSYFLAFSRLAPIQCNTWGHPAISGIPTIDYYLSSRYLETEHGQDHYTEKLYCLNSLLAFFYKPELPDYPKTREQFGFTAQQHLYLCPQSLFKLHPDFDFILINLLQRDPLGHVILVQGHDPHWGTVLYERFAHTIPSILIQRIHLLPRQSLNDYFNLILMADVVLDTLHFGGGGTTYEILAMGIPIVTCPSELMRSRFTYGCYQRMGLTDCIAHNLQHYVDIAYRLGTDPDYRYFIKSQILARNSVLYENQEVVAEFERFFMMAATSTNPL